MCQVIFYFGTSVLEFQLSDINLNFLMLNAHLLNPITYILVPGAVGKIGVDFRYV